MNYTLDNCKNCKEELPIVNKKYYLCDNCNKERLRGPNWKKEAIKKQFDSWKNNIKKDNSNIKKVNNDKKYNSNIKKVNSVSKTNTYSCSDGTRVTQEQINRKYKETCKLIDESREPVCESCGRSDRPLSHSHIISRDQAKKLGKTELVWDEANILIECYCPPGSNAEHCHNQHEMGKIEDHLTYEYKVAYVKEIIGK